VCDHKVGRATTVKTPNYWRARINAVQAAADLPPTLTEQALALLARLDALHVLLPQAVQKRVDGHNSRR
jgi:hypothetical protein